MTDAVAVIGGGIAGIQASLDLASAGVTVHLIERSPYLGGKMAQLDKTFPTNDCSTCILAPKLAEVCRHPHIHVHTLTEVFSLKGKSPDFSLTIRERARFVHEDRCIGCGACAERCPVRLSDEFDLGLSNRKAIYLPYAQAVPMVYTIDPEHCLMLTKGRCGNCREACPAEAIDYEMEDRYTELDVGAVIVTAGFDQMDPAGLAAYHHGEHPDIITSLQLERLLSPSGPSGGRLVRPSDGRPPRSIAFVQCAGSRDVRGYQHCSRFCCMASLKQAMVATEHEALDRITICYLDLRTYGKGFDAYRERAASSVRMLRGRVAEVIPGDPVRLRAEDTESDERGDITADLVVLSMAAAPPEGLGRLAGVLGFTIGSDGFIQTSHSGGSLTTDRFGVFAAGCCTGPKDITDSVCEASAAASLALSILPEIKKERPRGPKWREVEGEPPRIGVFICRCGTNIADVVDVPTVVEDARRLPHVVLSEENLFTCSESSLEAMISQIEEVGLNRVVVASCSPRTHEALFRETLSKAGLNPFLLEMVNIRDQCSWVHRDQGAQATRKAVDLVRMAVVKAALLKPLQPITAPVRKSVLVVGGGPAALSATMDLTRLDYPVTLVVEGKLNAAGAEWLGGLEAPDPAAMLDECHGVDLIENVSLRSVSGSVGDFRIELNDGRVVQTGAVILAPGGVGAPGKRPNAITSWDLDEMLRSDRPLPGRVTFVQCVGVRNEAYGCSRFCCRRMLSQALQLVEKGVEVSVLHHDIMAFQRGAEELYTEACRRGIRFFPVEEEPTYRGGRVRLRSITDGMLELPTDLLVESVGMHPSPSVATLSGMFKVPLSAEGFFLEKHSKLAPVEFAVDGIFMAGCAHYPKDLIDSVIQGSAAAAKAAGLLASGMLMLSPMICEIDQIRCRGCGECEDVCEFGAANLVERGGRKVSEIDPKLCKGCGACAVRCPTDAITPKGFTTDQLVGGIQAMLEGRE